MKRLHTLILLLFFTTIAFAQFNVTDYNDVPILDGDVRAFNTTESEGGTLYFWINNESETEDISVRIKLESITNGDGSSYQFCFATLCIFDVDEGQVYPVSGGPVVIPAGGTNPEFDKFFNENPGDGTNYPVDYVWKFYQVDSEDNEIGESITFTYRYDPNLSTTDFENNIGIRLQNTISLNTLHIESLNNLNYEILGLNGQLINKGQVNAGLNTLGTSALKTGLYFIKFSDNNQSKTFKFIVK